MTILTVSNSPTMRAVIQNMLHQIGHSEIEAAKSVDDALSQATACHPGLIIIDFHPRDRDATRFLENLEGLRFQTTVIALVDQSHATSLEPIHLQRIDRVVTKPFDRNALEAALNDVRIAA